jgi:hypothetical protein
MAYKIPIKRTAKFKVDEIRISYEELDNKAYLTYGCKYEDLDKKSQKEIALKVAKSISCFYKGSKIYNLKWHTKLRKKENLIMKVKL